MSKTNKVEYYLAVHLGHEGTVYSYDKAENLIETIMDFQEISKDWILGLDMALAYEES